MTIAVLSPGRTRRPRTVTRFLTNGTSSHELDANALFGTFTHRKNRYDVNARVTSATYYSQLNKCSHLQLAS